MTARTRPARPGAPYNRLREVMAHTPRYDFMPQARLARDAGVPKGHGLAQGAKAVVPPFPDMAE